jgi:hypothetical protein
MRYYKITINNPDKEGLKHITISEDMFKQLAPILNDKKLIKIGDGFINTSYIVLIEPDEEAMKQEKIAIQSREEVKKLMEKENVRNICEKGV